MTTPPAFHVMLKPRGAICNLDCAYCYYLPKEELYPGSLFRMSDELLEEYTRQYIAAQRVPEVTFAWQGGEPTLMGLDFFRRAVELQKQYRRPGMRILNALQTNATTLNAEWARFFRAHDFLVGISLDGPRELHDAYRVDKGGRPTFRRVMNGVELLKKHRVEFNLLTCVHAANANHPLEVYRFLRDEVGSQFIQFIPIVERDHPTGFPSERKPIWQEGQEVSERSVTGRQYGDFLIAIFDEWVRRDVGRVFVQIFDVALAAWMGQRPGLCIFEETCGTALAMEHNGDLFACDHFVEHRHRLGNLQELSLAEMAGSEQQRQFGQAKRDRLPRYCQDCQVRFVCNGGCPKNRILHTPGGERWLNSDGEPGLSPEGEPGLSPEGEPGLSYLCAGYKAFFTHIDRPMRIMVAELRAGRPAANIMFHLAKEEAEMQRRFAQARRNDPCPCGSGRKFKWCHGRPGRNQTLDSRTEKNTDKVI